MTAPALIIDRPGVFDIPADVYHLDPVAGGSLSSTGARKLLPPSCPALYKHWRDSGGRPGRALDFGRAAHREVLGVGEDIVVVDAADWRTKDAREARDAAYAAGQTPILAAEYDVVRAMAAAIREHPIAAALLRPGAGRAEQTLVWQDADTGVWCRARTDWLPDPGTGRLIVPDYKSARSAAPDDLSRAIHEHGYYLQADWYLSGIRALELHPSPAFVFIAQMKEPPYLVTVAEADPMALAIGAHLNRLARITYRECVESGRWPGWTDDVALVSLPPWVEARYAKELNR